MPAENRRYVVMGVSGCGKSSIGRAFADAVGGRFIEGDDLHAPQSIAKMASGQPLDDDDRAPWLTRIGQVLRDADGTVAVGCSALKRRYRDMIRAGAGGPVTFLHLVGSRAVIAERMRARQDHFMPPELLDSQFKALEPPQPDEDAVSVDIDQTPDAIVAALVRGIGEDGR